LKSTLTGYFVGTYPPGKRNLQLGMQVLANIMASHTNVYHRLKKLPNGQLAQIGIVKEYHQMDPHPTTNFLLFTIASYAHQYFNELMLEYFETGVLKAYIPLLIDIDYRNELGKTCNDFIGLNYYSHFNIMVNGIKIKKLVEWNNLSSY
jgi:beta-glucosidase/6-phospho-beta-glucosidase/beta-galactosidase